MHGYFKIYDLDFNEVLLPIDDTGHGFVGLDLFVSSIGQEVTEHSVQGYPGNVITGVRDNDRDVSISVLLKAMNSTDYRMKRDELYSFFRRLGAFYIAETQQGNKLLKVRVVDKYILNRPLANLSAASVDIPLKIDGQPYWLSRFKTMDLHNNKGIPTNGNWSFGMGLDVEPSKLVYQYMNTARFDIFNAGKDLKTIQEKDDCEIKVEVNQAVTGRFTISDGNGGRWVYNQENNADWALKNGDVITFNGYDIRLNGTSIMHRTNRYYLVIKEGISQFSVSGATQFKITFDFRFKYY